MNSCILRTFLGLTAATFWTILLPSVNKNNSRSEIVEMNNKIETELEDNGPVENIIEVH